MCNVYILYSSKLDRYYVGISKFRAKRHRQHLKGQTYWTSRADDWREIFHIAMPDMVTARVMEKKIKTRGAKRFLQTGREILPVTG